MLDKPIADMLRKVLAALDFQRRGFRRVHFVALSKADCDCDIALSNYQQYSKILFRNVTFRAAKQCRVRAYRYRNAIRAIFL